MIISRVISTEQWQCVLHYNGLGKLGRSPFGYLYIRDLKSWRRTSMYCIFQGLFHEGTRLGSGPLDLFIEQRYVSQLD